MSKAQRPTSRLWPWSWLINIELHGRRSGITLVFMICFCLWQPSSYHGFWHEWSIVTRDHILACVEAMVLPPLQGIWFTVSTKRLQVGRQLFSSALWVILGLWQRPSLPLWWSFWAFPVSVALVLRLLVRHEAVRQETLLCLARILEEGKATRIHTNCMV